MKHEIKVIKELLKLAIDMHLTEWGQIAGEFESAFDALESRFERLERSVAKLEAERR